MEGAGKGGAAHKKNIVTMRVHSSAPTSTVAAISKPRSVGERSRRLRRRRAWNSSATCVRLRPNSVNSDSAAANSSATNGRWLRPAMQLPRMAQWWSNADTHTPHKLQ
jgi:hypothetical protein